MTNVTRTAPASTTCRLVSANIASATTTTLAAAAANKKYRVLALAMVTGAAANNVNLESNTTDISAVFPLAANGGLVLPFNEHGWAETAFGEALGVTTSSAGPLGITVQYIEIPNLS